MNAIAPQITRFDLAPTIEGVEVVDTIDGRPVTGTFSNRATALEAKTSLNAAFLNGRAALRIALGAYEDGDDVFE